MSKTYWELLRDPRWQKKRLDVMQAADFTCQECERKDKTLNVHHTHYVKGRKPWEYDAASLRCLCEDCHALTERDLDEVRRNLGKLSDLGRQNVIGFVRGLVFLTGSDLTSPIRVENEYIAAGLSHAFSIDATLVRMMVKDGFVDPYHLHDLMVGRETEATTAQEVMRQEFPDETPDETFDGLQGDGSK